MVFVLDRNGKPLMPCTEKRARLLLARGRAPITAISSELVRFDMQQMQSPGIEGAEYQQGTLAGYEVREYLLEKWSRRCAYCDAQAVPLQIEHIQAKAQSGSNRISNLCLSCQSCNQKKAARVILDFLEKDQPRLAKILAQAKKPLRDAAAVNATRWALVNGLKATGLPVETGSGGLTKFNRRQLGIPKTHALDAACVGQMDAISGWKKPALAIKAMGRGSYQRTRLDRYGFPRGYLMRAKSVHGFQTGDMVKAVEPTGKKAGTHQGRVHSTVRQLQHHRCSGRSPGHQPQALPHRSEKRWVWLFFQPGRSHRT